MNERQKSFEIKYKSEKYIAHGYPKSNKKFQRKY